LLSKGRREAAFRFLGRPVAALSRSGVQMLARGDALCDAPNAPEPARHMTTNTTDQQTSAPIEHQKIMTLTADEFAKSIEAFAGHGVAIEAGRAKLAAGTGGSAEVEFEALPPRRLGGLLLLPQARVTITLAELGQTEAADFLKRFELAFQRGGG